MAYVKLFNDLNKLAQRVYPELMRRIVIINPPLIFSALFAIAKPFLFQRVIDKIKVVGGEPFDGLAEFIAPEHIPATYGAYASTWAARERCPAPVGVPAQFGMAADAVPLDARASG